MTKKQRARAQRAFLDAYGEIGVVSRAAAEAGVSRRTVYNWLQNDRQFREDFQMAEEDACDVLRSEMRRRAVDGVDKPVYYRGKLVGKIRKYSDALLMRMIEARVPEYRRGERRARAAWRAGAADPVATEVTVRYVDADGRRSVEARPT